MGEGVVSDEIYPVFIVIEAVCMIVHEVNQQDGMIDYADADDLAREDGAETDVASVDTDASTLCDSDRTVMEGGIEGVLGDAKYELGDVYFAGALKAY